MNRHSMIKLFKTPQKSVNINASKLFYKTPNGSVGKPRIFKKQVTHSNLDRISHLYAVYYNAARKYNEALTRFRNAEFNSDHGGGKKELIKAGKIKKKAGIIYAKARKAYVEVSKRVLYPKQLQLTTAHLTVAERNTIKKMAQKLVAKRSKLPNNVINKIFG